MHAQTDSSRVEYFNLTKRSAFLLWSGESACSPTSPADVPPLPPPQLGLSSVGALTVEPSRQECFRALISSLTAGLF